MGLVHLALALILVTASTLNTALAQGTPSREAPVGHRQPKATEVLPDQETSAEKKQKELDKALDKKLKSICRGC